MHEPANAPDADTHGTDDGLDPDLWDLDDLEVGDDALMDVTEVTVRSPGHDRPSLDAHFGKLG